MRLQNWGGGWGCEKKFADFCMLRKFATCEIFYFTKDKIATVVSIAHAKLICSTSTEMGLRNFSGYEISQVTKFLGLFPLNSGPPLPKIFYKNCKNKHRKKFKKNTEK